MLYFQLKVQRIAAGLLGDGWLQRIWAWKGTSPPKKNPVHTPSMAPPPSYLLRAFQSSPCGHSYWLMRTMHAWGTLQLGCKSLSSWRIFILREMALVVIPATVSWKEWFFEKVVFSWQWDLGELRHILRGRWNRHPMKHAWVLTVMFSCLEWGWGSWSWRY